MKQLAKGIYIVKVILFIIQFYFVFIMLHSIIDTKIYGIIFIVLYLLFVFKILIEILSKKLRYKHDFVYNLMQIGFMIYLLFISIKTYLAKIYVTRLTVSYFKINFIILSLLMAFILIYSWLELSTKNNVK